MEKGMALESSGTQLAATCVRRGKGPKLKGRFYWYSFRRRTWCGKGRWCPSAVGGRRALANYAGMPHAEWAAQLARTGLGSWHGRPRPRSRFRALPPGIGTHSDLPAAGSRGHPNRSLSLTGRGHYGPPTVAYSPLSLSSFCRSTNGNWPVTFPCPCEGGGGNVNIAEAESKSSSAMGLSYCPCPCPPCECEWE